ncbi:hypothetical protein [Mumia sp. ZJ430]|uniref:hypothetical protein n=1 Tax=Mumia sp. ZJ430 TaxID=2708083 RepID=UPI00142102CC|nr:hypothetical protein [Mumia sp. ZJ430]
MSGIYDPVAHDDELLDALIAGDVPDDPVFEALASWRAVLLDDAAATPTTSKEALPAPVPLRAGRSHRRHVAPVAARHTRRAATMGTAAAVLLSMGVSQAVAGNPVAPLQFVVERAVGLGEGLADPNASDARAPRTPPATAAATSPEMVAGRADADALASRSVSGEQLASDESRADGGDRDEKEPQDRRPSDGPPAPPGTPPTASPTPAPPWTPDPREPRGEESDRDRDDHDDDRGRGDDDRDDRDDRTSDRDRPWWLSGLWGSEVETRG